MSERAVAMKDSFTVTTWANIGAGGLWRDVVSQGGDRRSGFVVTFEPSTRKWMAVVTPGDDNGSAMTAAVSEHPAALNQWSHLAAVHDAAARQLRLYVNGNLTGWADGVTTWDARSWFAVGRGLWQGSRTDYFAGAVDDVRTYQGILADEQIRLLAAG